MVRRDEKISNYGWVRCGMGLIDLFVKELQYIVI